MVDAAALLLASRGNMMPSAVQLAGAILEAHAWDDLRAVREAYVKGSE